LLIGLLAFGLFAIERANPEQTWRYYKIGLVAIVSSSLWFWYERLVPLIEATEYGIFVIIILVGFFIWLIQGIYRSRSPIDK
jgi:hypothetical protein